jgi:plastocyanin
LPSKLRRSVESGWTSRPAGLALCAIAGMIAASVAALPSRAGADVTVSQRNREFNPSRLTVKRGTVVHIVNDDKVTHHVYVDTATMRFDSGEQPIGKNVDLVFDHAGNFPVQCAIHPTMHLEVVVAE